MATRSAAPLGTITFALVGFLFLVELVERHPAGLLRAADPRPRASTCGIHDADFNWFEAAQLLLSAIVVPILAKLGDMFGHKRILLHLDGADRRRDLVARVHRRLHELPDRVGAAGLLRGVAAARGRADLRPRPPHAARARRRPDARPDSSSSPSRRARSSARSAARACFGALGDDVTLTLIVPAIAVTPRVLRDPVRRARVAAAAGPHARRRRLRAALARPAAHHRRGSTFLRINGARRRWWVVTRSIARSRSCSALRALVFARCELRQPDPAIDLRVLRQPTMWPRAAHRRPLRHLACSARRHRSSTFAGDRSGRARLRPRPRRGCALVPDRRLPRVDDRRRAAVPGRLEAALARASR